MITAIFEFSYKLKPMQTGDDGKTGLLRSVRCRLSSAYLVLLNFEMSTFRLDVCDNF